MAVTGLTTLLTACGDDDFADLQQYVTEVKSRKKEPVPPLPVVKTVEPFPFIAEQVRDPFTRAPHEEEDAARQQQCSASPPDPSRPKEPLEAYELDALRMVGTVKVGRELWGLIKAKDDTIHRVRAGSYMGRRFGRVVAVKPDGIDLIENVEQRPCVWEEQPQSLDLIESGDRKS